MMKTLYSNRQVTLQNNKRPLRLALLAAILLLGNIALSVRPLQAAPEATCAIGILSPYETFQAALDDSACATIEVYNSTLSGSWLIDRDVHIVGKTQIGPVIATFEDGANGASIFRLTPNIDVTIDSITFKNGRSSTGGAIQNLNESSSLTILNSHFQGNQATTSIGGAIASRGPLTIKRTTFINNRADLAGGAIHQNPSSTIDVLIENSVFDNNHVTDGHSGALYVLDGNVTVRNSTFKNNSSSMDAGAVQFHAASSAVIENSTFSNNSAGTLGGALRILSAATSNPMVIRSTEFNNNSADQHGGAIYATGSLTNLNISNATFSGNAVELEGGAIYHKDGTFSIENSEFSNNNAATLGGALRILDVATTDPMIITASQFNDNSAEEHGGAIYATGSLTNLNISDSTFSGNHVEVKGGAIHQINGTLQIDSTLFEHNRVGPEETGGAIDLDIQGGGIYKLRGQMMLTNSTLQYNVSNTFGGGLMLNNVSDASISTTYFFANRGLGGAGIFNLASTLTIEDSAFTANVLTLDGQQGVALTTQNGSTTIKNSTFSNNADLFDFGASILALIAGSTDEDSSVTIINSTIMEDSIGSITASDENSGDSVVTVTLQNSVISSSNSSDCHVKNGDVLIDASLGYNRDTDGTCVTDGVDNNQTIADPLLAPLAVYEGSTPTQPPLPSSPLIDQIPNGVNGCGTDITDDQGGTSRPQNNSCEIGAVEIVPNSCIAQGYAFPYDVGTVLPSDHAADLQAAIDCANQNNMADIINLTADVDLLTVAATVNGNSGLPSITSDITLNGNGFTIARDETLACSGDTAFRLLHVATSGSLTLDDATLANGCVVGADSDARGGAIWNEGTLLLRNQSQILDNQAGAFGGGIYNIGSLTADSVTFSGNQRVGNGTLQGGAIYSDGSLTLNEVGITGNSADFGAGVYHVAGTADIQYSSIYNNTGGAASAYGGLYNGGTMAITNTTVGDNTADSHAGLFNAAGATLDLTYVTVAFNVASQSSGGLGNEGTLTLTSSLLANNGVSDCLNDGAGTVNNGQYNLIFSATNCLTADATNIIGEDPQLNLLADHGGGLPGYSFNVGESPAGNHIPDGSGCGTGTTDDQRHVVRPQDAACEIGALEMNRSQEVDKLGDEDDGNYGVGELTLREAVNLTLADESTFISFAAALAGETIFLDETLVIEHQTVIYGNDVITISGRDAVRLFAVDDALVYFIALTLIDGAATDSLCYDSTQACGGAIFAHAGSEVYIWTSTLSGHSAAALGGAVFNAAGSTLTILDSTFHGNEGAFGGALNNHGSLTVTNSTFVNNMGLFGTAMQIFSGDAIITHSTLYDDATTEAAFVLVANVPVTIGHSIVAGTDSDVINCFASGAGAWLSQGYNLAGDDSCGFGNTGDMNSTDPLLLPLADNGGLTWTMLPDTNSPARDVIPFVNGSCNDSGVSLDQRGLHRPEGTHCDIGAVERAAPWAVEITAVLPTSISLGWGEDDPDCSYDVYEATSPYTPPTTPTYEDVSTNYSIANRIGDPVTNYFFITAATCNSETTYSNEVGAFDFSIVPGS
ncbi:MAG: choice-of-anchor Q domain-containing protein [Chloroflexota bacterium]